MKHNRLTEDQNERGEVIRSRTGVCDQKTVRERRGKMRGSVGEEIKYGDGDSL